jgi:hypothetical protein
MECCVEQLFRLPTTRILAWNICWLAPSTGTNRDHFLQAEHQSRMAGLDYFLFADNPSDIQHAEPLESELTRPRYRPLSDTVCSSRL